MRVAEHSMPRVKEGMGTYIMLMAEIHSLQNLQEYFLHRPILQPERKNNLLKKNVMH